MTTLIAVISIPLIGGLFSLTGLIISKDQKISEFREKWINNLRDEVSNFISTSLYIITYAKMAKMENPDKNKREIINLDFLKNISEQYEVSEQYYAKIKIRLSNNKEYKEFNDCLYEIKCYVTKDPFDSDDKFDAIQERLMEITNELIKNEWIKVKKGENSFLNIQKVLISLLLVIIVTVLFFYLDLIFK